MSVRQSCNPLSISAPCQLCQICEINSRFMNVFRKQTGIATSRNENRIVQKYLKIFGFSFTYSYLCSVK